MKDISFELKGDISVKISNKRCTGHGWKEIGEFLKITKQKIEEIEARCCYGVSKLPGEYLFDFLESSRPELTVKDFIEVLKAIKRNDVISYILEECCKK